MDTHLADERGEITASDRPAARPLWPDDMKTPAAFRGRGRFFLLNQQD